MTLTSSGTANGLLTKPYILLLAWLLCVWPPRLHPARTARAANTWTHPAVRSTPRAWRGCLTAASTCPRRRSGAWASARCYRWSRRPPRRWNCRAVWSWTRTPAVACRPPTAGASKPQPKVCPWPARRSSAAKCWPMCATTPNPMRWAASRPSWQNCAASVHWPISVCSASKAWKARCRAKEIEAARAEAQSLQQRERSIGASLATREALVAPVSGVIAGAEVLAGQVVEARDVLFEVVDPVAPAGRGQHRRHATRLSRAYQARDCKACQACS